MSQAFVVDASVTIAWVHLGQATDRTQRLLDSIEQGAVLHVPALWPLEVANVLLVLIRRGELTAAQRRKTLK